MDYYYTDASNQTRGPVSLAELQQLATTGQVTPATMVAAVGSQQWVSVTTVLPNLGTTPPPGPAGAPLSTAPGAPGVPAAAAPTEPLSIWSLVLGILSCTLCCGVGFLTGIPAVICGHMALTALKKKPGFQGRGMAIAGLVTGYLATIGSIIYLLVWGGALIVQLISGSSH